ncbi:MAG: type II secretion system protein N [Granulosicoccus sp.]
MSEDASSLSMPRQSAMLRKVVNVLLVIALGVAMALLSIKLLPAPSAKTLVDVGNPAVFTQNKAPSPVELARGIAAAHLFGNMATKPAPVKVEKPQEPITETRLNLQLAGVFAFEPAENAFAIISAGSAEQAAYGVGDKINRDTTLEAVYADHVVLRNGGKLEKLALPENVQPIAMQSSAPASGATLATQTASASETVELPTNPGELRDTLARNPSMLGKVVAAEPYQENGKLVGYRITPKQNPEILESQGIMSGDVITRVNNIQLNSQKQGIRALRNAVKAQNLDVVVLRDGIEIPISISLAQ